MVRPVCQSPVNDLKDEGEFPEEAGEQTVLEMRSVGVGDPVFYAGSVLLVVEGSAKKRRCGQLGVEAPRLGHRLALRW